MYNNYRMSDYDSIFKAYSRPSYNKISAWERCKKICNEYDGNGLKVVSKNTFVFTAGFTFTENGKKYYMHITPSRLIKEEI